MRGILGLVLALSLLPAWADEKGAKAQEQEALLRDARQAVQAGHFDEAERLAAELEAKQGKQGPEVKALRDEILLARGAEARRRLPGLDRDAAPDGGGGGRRRPESSRAVAGLRERLRDSDSRPEPEPAWLRALRERLGQTVHIRFDSIPFKDALAMIQESLRVAIVVDRLATEAKPGLDEMPVSLASPDAGLTLRSVLNLLTVQVGLKWTLRDEAVLITTEEGVEEPPVTREYDVHDLRMRLKDFPGPTLKLGAAGTGIQLDPPGDDGPEPLSEEELMGLLKDVLDKKPAGGRQ